MHTFIQIYGWNFIRFGQAGGFVKLRERFETIMGFQKPDLTSSVNSEEKVSLEITEKESEDIKSINTEDIEIAPVISESSEVCVVLNFILSLSYLLRK